MNSTFSDADNFAVYVDLGTLLIILVFMVGIIVSVVLAIAHFAINWVSDMIRRGAHYKHRFHSTIHPRPQPETAHLVDERENSEGSALP